MVSKCGKRYKKVWNIKKGPKNVKIYTKIGSEAEINQEFLPHMLEILQRDPGALLRPSKPPNKAFGFVQSFESMTKQGL